MSHYDYLVVGAGFSGAVLAERLASVLDKRVLVVDRRAHIGGNAYDAYDEHGILIHHYGPHLFHTNSRAVFDYLSAFTAWRPYVHRVLAASHGVLYPMPINRITVGRFEGRVVAAGEETERYFAERRSPRSAIRNSEDVIVDRVGQRLFEAFFRDYTTKQWRLAPKDLHPGVCGRIPVRTDGDTRYFSDDLQVVPLHGYTALFERLLAHPRIEVATNTDHRAVASDVRFDRLVFTGPIDEYFDHVHGRLPYRSLRFEHRSYEVEWYQPVAQINLCDAGVPRTRQCEWKHITGQSHPMTTVTREYPVADGEPYYPVPAEDNHRRYAQYRAEAAKLRTVSFVGRLAEYRYYNMDQVVARALHAFEEIARA